MEGDDDSVIRKEDSVGDGFLEVVRKHLAKDFLELKYVASLSNFQ